MPKKIQAKNSYLIGIISDTHGRLPLSVTKAFDGADLIIHAGDIGGPEIIEALEEIAPTIVVRGNMDFGEWANRFSAEERIEINKLLLVVLHDVYRFRSTPGKVAPDVVISGHTHRPLQEEKLGVLYINPGSAGYPKFGQPATVALLQINGDSVKAHFLELKE